MLELKVKKINGDGSATCEFYFDQDFESFYRQKTGAKVVRKYAVGKFVLHQLEDAFSTPKTKKQKKK